MVLGISLLVVGINMLVYIEIYDAMYFAYWVLHDFVQSIAFCTL
jgi:hypothetical protein